MNEFNYLDKCPICKRTFKVHETEQPRHCRNNERLICPYCQAVVTTSMEYEFDTEMMED